MTNDTAATGVEPRTAERIADSVVSSLETIAQARDEAMGDPVSPSEIRAEIVYEVDPLVDELDQTDAEKRALEEELSEERARSATLATDVLVLEGERDAARADAERLEQDLATMEDKLHAADKARTAAESTAKSALEVADAELDVIRKASRDLIGVARFLGVEEAGFERTLARLHEAQGAV